MATSLKAQTQESSGKGRLNRTLKRKGRPAIQEESLDYGKVPVTGMRETAFSPALPSNRHFKLRVTKGGRKTQRKDARLGTEECLPSLINRFKMPCQRGERGKETEDTGRGGPFWASPYRAGTEKSETLITRALILFFILQKC